MFTDNLEKKWEKFIIDSLSSDDELEQKKKEAEAKAYIAEQEARAIKAEHEAKKYTEQQNSAPLPNENSTSTTPKSNKHGEARKCPNCGEVVQAYLATCSACGFEFSNVEANASAQKLADEVKKSPTEEKKKEVINLFPIPNTKADLLEFLTSLQPKMRDIKDPLAHTYFKKYEECIVKAQLSFANDPHVKPFIESFNIEKKELSKKQRWSNITSWVSSHKKTTIALVIFLVILLVSGIQSLFSTSEPLTSVNDEKLCNEAVAQAIAEKDLTAAVNNIKKYKYADYWIVDSYIAMCEHYLNDSKYDEAIALVNEYLVETANADKYNDNVTNARNKLFLTIYTPLIKNAFYEDAEKYIPYEYSSVKDSDYYDYMRTCIEAMCMNGEVAKAKKFLQRKAVHFSSNSADDEYTVSKVTNTLNTIISTY